METNDRKIYERLKIGYLIVYLPANFIDWLQGPYLYKLYSSFGYKRNDISLLYIFGFGSAGLFGVFIGHWADKFGRKKICLLYFLTSIVSCLLLTIFNNNYELLKLGRIFGGISTSILFSTFESWYVGQHLDEYELGKELIVETFSQSTIYNGFSAIAAGILSSLLVDKFNFGMTAPYLLAIPLLMINFVICLFTWDDNQSINKSIYHNTSPLKGLELILFKNYLIYLGLIQILIDTLIYVFIFIWTPILEPIKPSYGFVFSLFMLSTVIGSYLYSFLINLKYSHESLLYLSVVTNLISISICTIGIYVQLIMINYNYLGTLICLSGFLLFELSVGLYYPSISYYRSITTPESDRTNIFNWFKLPSNVFICIILIYINHNTVNNLYIFILCIILSTSALLFTIRFVYLYSINQNLPHHSHFTHHYKLLNV